MVPNAPLWAGTVHVDIYNSDQLLSDRKGDGLEVGVEPSDWVLGRMEGFDWLVEGKRAADWGLWV